MEILDVDFPVLKEMLHYIYTGSAPNIDSMAEALIAAADKVGLAFNQVLLIIHFTFLVDSTFVLMTDREPRLIFKGIFGYSASIPKLENFPNTARN